MSGHWSTVETNVLPISGTIPGLSMAEFSTAAQEPFRARRLVIPSYLSPSFEVVDIKVGKNSQLAGATGGIPAAVFSETAYDTGVFFDKAEVGKKLNIQIRNTTPGSRFFSAGVLGDVFVTDEISGEEEADEEMLYWQALAEVPRRYVRRKQQRIIRPRRASLITFGGWL